MFFAPYRISSDALAEHYGSRLSSGAFANLFDALLLQNSP